MAKRTIWYMFHSVHSVDGQLGVSATAVSPATPEAVWALISDATTYCQWGPWSAAAYRGDATRHEPGVVYWLRAAQRTLGYQVTTIERVEEMDEGRRVVYAVIGGMPVRNYRGEVVLTPVAGGTQIAWSASWDKTAPGRLVLRGLRPFFPRVVTGLAAAA
jgi:hypothetical protein